MRWRERGPYPENDIWAHIPPWERPGWKNEKGWCWWCLGTPSPRRYVLPTWIDRCTDIEYLEDLKNYLDELKKRVEARIEELKRNEK